MFGIVTDYINMTGEIRRKNQESI